MQGSPFSLRRDAAVVSLAKMSGRRTTSIFRSVAMFFFAYGVASYVLFFVTFLYLVCFIGNIGVPKSIDSGAAGPVGVAILVNFLLVALFGVQHSIMARPWFKAWWTRFVPKPIERSTFVLITSVILIVTYWLWRPIPGVVWDVELPAARAALYALFFLGWGLMLYASFLIDHFDLFGVRQVYLHLRRQKYTHSPFATPPLYKVVRNPLMLGVLIALWATPTMTYGHLLFAALMSAYIFVGIAFEERDLLRFLGEDYRRYRERTPMILPWPRYGHRDKAIPTPPHTPEPSG
jgi:protein-S-isoprenylcysteine O-methyltransferase Ste14